MNRGKLLAAALAALTVALMLGGLGLDELLEHPACDSASADERISMPECLGYVSRSSNTRLEWAGAGVSGILCVILFGRAKVAVK